MCITQIDNNHQLTLFTVEAQPKNALNGSPAHNTMKMRRRESSAIKMSLQLTKVQKTQQSFSLYEYEVYDTRLQ
jgi:hypothetical protein